MVAVGADFRPETVVAGYMAGAFPWPHEEQELLWFSPNPRAVLPLDRFHTSRRLARTIKQSRFRVTVDCDFPKVIELCSSTHEDTWITPALRAAYCELHRLGWAHSVEVWGPDGDLAGGLYGVGVGRLFGAESMFHVVRDASKVAVAGLVRHLKQLGVAVVDLQVLNPHTESLGAIEIPRDRYLAEAIPMMRERLDWSGR